MRFNAARSDSIRPAIDRIWVGVALPVRSALPAMLASALLGGFSGVVFLAILVLPFQGLVICRIGDNTATRVRSRRGYSVRTWTFLLSANVAGCSLGILTFSTPCLNAASMRSVATSGGKRNDRWKAPYSRSEKK